MKIEQDPAQPQPHGHTIGSNGRVWVTDVQNPGPWRDIGVVCDRVETIETHRAWVFLAGDRALKVKKPCREAFLDFSTAERREAACREELRLNRRLAPAVYLGLVGLQRTPQGLRMVQDPLPEIHAGMQDWAILMERLPADRMLDHRLRLGPPPTPGELEALADVLARFWAQTPRADIETTAYLDGFALEHARNIAVLQRGDLGASAEATPLLARFETALSQARPALRARAQAGHLRDGHGDLQPEHIALTDPPVVIDALEFNASMRAQDPYDELAFLDLECARLGAPDIGAAVIKAVAARLRERPPERLLPLYRAHRALLRARLALAHLLEQPVQHPQRWPARAAGYLRQAELALDALAPIDPAADAGDGARRGPQPESVPQTRAS